MSKKQKTTLPKLRFPEFKNDGEWKEDELGKLADRITAKNKNSMLSRVLTNSATHGVVDQSDYFDKDIANKANLEGYCIVDKGDYVYNPRTSVSAPVGPISKNKIGLGVMSPLYTVFRFKNENNAFFEHYFKSSYWHNYLHKVSNTGARHDRISLTNGAFMVMPLPCPPTQKEQQKIADCLSSIDEVVNLEEKKLNELQEHKKGLVQNLFPAEGETLPKFRFPEFKNDPDWEEKPLIKLAKFRRGSFPQPYGLPEWYDNENGMPFIQVYDVDDNLLLKPNTKSKISKLASEQSVFIKKGTIIITIQGSIGRVAITQYDAYIDRTLLLFEEFYTSIEKTFFAYALQILFDIEKQKAPGGIIKTITKEVLSNFLIKFPKLKEQQKIANCLSSIDETITAQEQKIEELKEHKKGLLQQLFPNPEEVQG